ncbi:Unknown protein, partial [Striga hermonthica]
LGCARLSTQIEILTTYIDSIEAKVDVPHPMLDTQDFMMKQMCEAEEENYEFQRDIEDISKEEIHGLGSQVPHLTTDLENSLSDPSHCVTRWTRWYSTCSTDALIVSEVDDRARVEKALFLELGIARDRTCFIQNIATRIHRARLLASMAKLPLLENTKAWHDHLRVDPSFWRRLWEVLEGIKSFAPSSDPSLMAEKKGLQMNMNEEFWGAWTDRRPPPLSTPRPPVMQVLGLPPFGGLPPPGVSLGGETPITPPGVKMQVLTPAGASQNPYPNGGSEQTEISRREGKQIQEVPEQTLAQPRVEEQTMTMTRSEMQKMIAEAITAQLKQTQTEQPRVEQPRVEPLRIEQPNFEREQQAQSNERLNRRAEEEASSIRTVNPRARDDTLEQLLAQVRDLQARVEGRKTGGSKGHPFSQHILDADLPPGFCDLNISYDGSNDPSRLLRSFENMAVLHRYNDPVQCQAFLTTLRGSAQDWFHQLPSGAIKDFDGFNSSFLNQFSSVKPQEKSNLTLMGLQQKEGESLRDYVVRYTRTCVDVPRALEEIKAGGLTRGLLPGLCRNSLAKCPSRMFDEVLGR